MKTLLERDPKRKSQIEITEQSDLSGILNEINDLNKQVSTEFGVEPKLIADILNKEQPATDDEKKALDGFLAQVIKKDVTENLIDDNGRDKYGELIKKAFAKTADLKKDIKPQAEKQFFADLNQIYRENNRNITPDLVNSFQEGLGRIYGIDFVRTKTPIYLDQIEFAPDLSEILNELPPVMKCPIYNDHLGEYHNVRQSFARYLELNMPEIVDSDGDNMIRSHLEKVLMKAGTLQKIPFLLATLKMYGDYGMAQLTNDQKKLMDNLMNSEDYKKYNEALPDYKDMPIEERIKMGESALKFSQELIDGFATNLDELKAA